MLIQQQKEEPSSFQDDHYARLYGPAVMVHQQVAADHDQGEKRELTEAEKAKLMNALADTPFTRYRTKAFHQVRQLAKKVKIVFQTPFSGGFL